MIIHIHVNISIIKKHTDTHVLHVKEKQRKSYQVRNYQTVQTLHRDTENFDTHVKQIIHVFEVLYDNNIFLQYMSCISATSNRIILEMHSLRAHTTYACMFQSVGTLQVNINFIMHCMFFFNQFMSIVHSCIR